MYLQFPSFTAGELSPLLEGRSDLAALRMGCRLVRNMIPQKLGPLLQRPGFIYRGDAQTQAEMSRVCLLRFVVSADTAYVIEASDNYFRFWRNNSLILTSAGNVGQPGVISGIGDPLLIATPYTSAQCFQLQMCAANDVMWIAHGSHPVYKLSRYAVDEFKFEAMSFIFPPLRDVNVEDITVAATGDLTVGGVVAIEAVGGDVFTADNVGGYFGISHRRELPFVEVNLNLGSSDAIGVLALSAQPSDGEQISIGNTVYTAKTAVAAPYQVALGANLAAFSANFVNAVNGVDDGTTVGAGTAANPDVTAGGPVDITAGTFATATLTINVNTPGFTNLIAGAYITITVLGVPHTFTAVNSGAGANQFNLGADQEGTLDNIITAVNTAAIGATFSARTGRNAVLTADTAGVAGNSIAVVRNTGGGASLNWLSWSSPTLQGGAAGSTTQITVTARIPGDGGNGIPLTDTLAAGAWTTTETQGGVSVSKISEELRIVGQWEVVSFGLWYGIIRFQVENDGAWETVRAWSSKNDYNIQATGTVDGGNYRLTFEGTGTEAEGALPRAVLTALNAVVDGAVLITAVTDPTHATGTVVNEIWSEGPTLLWADGSWSERYGYPWAVTLHQQRLTFGQGERIIGSQTGGFDNFARTEFADASYQYELAAQSQAHIVALQSNQDGLMILAEDSEWLADGGTDGGVITPQGIRMRRLTSFGAARAVSELVGSNVIFIQAGNTIVNEYLFQWTTQDYNAVDLGELADHLTSQGVKQLTFAPNPHSLLYFVTNTGSLLSLSYRRQQGGANEGGMLAWSRITTPDASSPTLSNGSLNGGAGLSLGVFESVCAVPGTNEITDVWVAVRRQLPDGSFIRTIESYDLYYWENLRGGVDALPSLCTLDGAVIRTGMIGITPTVTGLDHLEGLTVAVLFNGVRHPDRVVEGGLIQIDPSYFPAEGTSTAVVGLAPGAQLQPWFATPQMQDGGSDGRTFKVAKLNTRFYLSGAAQYADDNEGAPFYDVDFRLGTDEVNQPVPLRTRLIKSDLGGGYLTESQFIFRNDGPLCMNILGVTAEISIHSA